MDKNSQFFKKYRDYGNLLFLEKDYFGALINYNKALAYAVTNDDLSLAYANRSAVFFELKKYDECLQNIQWARENQYPQDKLEKLKIREEKCKKLKEEDKTEVPESFFKLSYPPNPKIPFIIENLTMRKSKKFGRGIYATTDLNPGDVIALEKPAVFFLVNKDDTLFKHCCFCLSTCQMNLIPCTKTAAVMFCSEECRDKTYQVSHKSYRKRPVLDQNLSIYAKFCSFLYNCNSPDDILRDFNSNNYGKTIFDLDLSDHNDENYQKNLLECILALKSKQPKDSEGVESEEEEDDNYTNHINGIWEINAKPLQFRVKDQLLDFCVHAKVLLAFGCLINHSCTSNVDIIFVDGKFAFIVKKPIKRKTQIFVHYKLFLNQVSTSERQQELQNNFDFTCQCDSCINDDIVLKFGELNNSMSAMLRPLPKTYEEVLHEFKENLKYIRDYTDSTRHTRSLTCMIRNSFLLNPLAEFETFPGIAVHNTDFLQEFEEEMKGLNIK